MHTNTLRALQARQISALPTEIWWSIIDALQQDWCALLVCVTVCKSWRARARLYLPRGSGPAVFLSSRHDVLRLSRFARVRATPLHTRAVHVYGDSARGGSFAHLSAFATMLSGSLPWLEDLHLIHGAWDAPGMLAPAVFRYLPGFATIRNLRLHDVTFPSTTTLARLLGALRGVRSLHCVRVRTTHKRYDEPAKLRMLLGSGPRLEEFVLDCPEGDDIGHFFGVVDVAAYCRTVKIGSYRLPTMQEARWQYHETLIRGLHGVSDLIIVFHDVSSVHPEIVPYLSMVLQHCDELETLSIRVVPPAAWTTAPLKVLCTIPSLVTERFNLRYITVHPGPPLASDSTSSHKPSHLFDSPDTRAASQTPESEEVVWVRFEQGSFGVPTGFAHFTIPSSVTRSLAPNKEAWVDQIKQQALETESAAGLRHGEAQLLVWMRYAHHPDRPRPWFYPAVAPGLFRFSSEFTQRLLANPARVSRWRRTYVIVCPYPVGHDDEAERGRFLTRFRFLKGRHTYIWAVEERAFTLSVPVVRDDEAHAEDPGSHSMHTDARPARSRRWFQRTTTKLRDLVLRG